MRDPRAFVFSRRRHCRFANGTEEARCDPDRLCAYHDLVLRKTTTSVQWGTRQQTHFQSSNNTIFDLQCLYSLCLSKNVRTRRGYTVSTFKSIAVSIWAYTYISVEFMRSPASKPFLEIACSRQQNSVCVRSGNNLNSQWKTWIVEANRTRNNGKSENYNKQCHVNYSKNPPFHIPA